MATYDIAPATTGSEIGLAQMRFGLSASADYNASNLYTAGATSLRTISQSPDDYQSNLTSQTWNTASPYGFGELAGQTWNDVIAATLSYSITDNTAGTSVAVTIRQNSLSGTILYNGGVGSGTANVNSGDTIYVTCNISNSTDPFQTLGQYEVPLGGTVHTLFFQSSGPGGGTMAPSGNFTITSGQTTAGLNIEIS